jgi:hypothetical protein
MSDSKLMSGFPEMLTNYSVYICVCVLNSRIALSSFIQEVSTFTELSTLRFFTLYPYFKFPALPEFLGSRGSGTGSTEPREDNRGAN